MPKPNPALGRMKYAGSRYRVLREDGHVMTRHRQLDEAVEAAEEFYKREQRRNSVLGFVVYDAQEGRVVYDAFGSVHI